MEDSINIYEEKRPWGSFRRFNQNSISTVKIITINPDGVLSLQSHAKRSEFWRVVYGSGAFFVDGIEHKAERGSEQYVPSGVKHKMSAGKEGMEVLEIGIGQFDENDIIRYEDIYGRVK